jgi:hypothetical protein
MQVLRVTSPCVFMFEGVLVDECVNKICEMLCLLGHAYSWLNSY